MRTKVLFMGAIALVAVLAAFGAWRQSTSGAGDLTKPIQPFYADYSLSGFSDTSLGAQVPNYVYTHIPIGVRISVPWIFNGPGYYTPSEEDAAGVGIGIAVGGIKTILDVQCNGVRDEMSQAGGGALPYYGGAQYDPYPWVATTTAARGTSADFLYAQVPPYPWIYRDTANPDTFWIGGHGGAQFGAVVQLNTVYTTLPFSPNGGAGTATTKNNGNPHVIDPVHESVCIDSPENTDSTTAVNTNPPKLPNSGNLAGNANAADGFINALTAATPAPSGALGALAANAISATFGNRGPNAGTFSAQWNAFVVDGTIASAAMASPTTENRTNGQALADSNNLNVTCNAAGKTEIAISVHLSPTGLTVEGYPADNDANLSVVVTCGSPSANPTPVDKEVVIVVPTLPVVSTALLDSPPSPFELNINSNAANPWADVNIKEVKANDSTVASVPGHEALLASGPVVSHTWQDGVTIKPVGTPVATVTPVADSSVGGVDIRTYAVNEPKGQSTVNTTLRLDCPAGVTGRFAVDVTAIDWPDWPTYTETDTGDNIGHFVIMVNCWANPSDLSTAQAANVWPVGGPHAGTSIDGGTGLYTRWAIFQSNPDARLTFSSPPSFPSDDGMDTKLQNPSGGYVERTLDEECFWHDASGCLQNGGASCDTLTKNADGDIVTVPAGTGDTWISAAESHLDGDLTTLTNTATGKSGWDAIDADHDCLIDQGITGPAAVVYQPGHPVDLPFNGGTCSSTSTPPWVVYAGAPAPTPVAGSQNADQDCDGLPDGVEVAYGSNPLANDTDNDGAKDFVEMFQFTNPNNPDTDGDGFLDKPSGVFGDNTDASQDNCPTVSNVTVVNSVKTQLNSDGKHRSVGINYPTEIAPVTTNPVGGPATLTTQVSANTWPANTWNTQFLLCLNTDGSTKGFIKVASTSSGHLFNAALYNGVTTWQGTDPAGSCPGGIEFTMILLNKASNPNKDKMGDACDPDNDNDGLPDVVEAAMGTNPFNADSDVNHCVDGNEAYSSMNPATADGNCPTQITDPQVNRFYRACWWNLPPLGAYGSVWDGKYSTNVDRSELDPDGDGPAIALKGNGDCQSADGTTVGPDLDSDNGTGTGAGKTEVNNVVEIYGYNTNPSMKDTDGDGCPDWVQINDINGDGKILQGDLLNVAQGIPYTAPGKNPVSDEILDVNKDNKINNGDLLQVANNLCAVKTCPTICTTSVY